LSFFGLTYKLNLYLCR